MLTSFVAIGDSFTEGLNDFGADGAVLGWADRFAATLDAAHPGMRYANLAIRGRLLDQIVDDQVPAAIAARPSVIGFSAGGNDILRVGSDPDDVAARYGDAVERLRAAGSRVLVFTGFDVGTTPVLRLARGKIAIYNEHLRVIAARHGCDVVDLWSLDTLRDRRSFSEDRLHLSADGHERVARLVAQVLGVPADDPDEPWPDAEMPPVNRRDDLHWARDYLLPWVGRRVRHQSSGDGIEPKRPELDILRRTGT
jgi:lysophospholipase L1-like esterase